MLWVKFMSMVHPNCCLFTIKLSSHLKRKSRVRVTLTLLTCADNNIVSKKKWVRFGTHPRF